MSNLFPTVYNCISLLGPAAVVNEVVQFLTQPKFSFEAIAKTPTGLTHAEPFTDEELKAWSLYQYLKYNHVDDYLKTMADGQPVDEYVTTFLASQKTSKEKMIEFMEKWIKHFPDSSSCRPGWLSEEEYTVRKHTVADKDKVNVFNNPAVAMELSDDLSKRAIEEVGHFIEANKKAYRVSSAYDWRLKNWGIGQDVQDSRVIQNSIYYTTKYSASMSLIQLLSKKYPQLQFEHLYVSEDCAAQRTKFGAGTLLEMNIYSDDTNRKYYLSLLQTPFKH
jgi:hypothetical protein